MSQSNTHYSALQGKAIKGDTPVEIFYLIKCTIKKKETSSFSLSKKDTLEF